MLNVVSNWVFSWKKVSQLKHWKAWNTRHWCWSRSFFHGCISTVRQYSRIPAHPHSAERGHLYIFHPQCRFQRGKHSGVEGPKNLTFIQRHSLELRSTECMHSIAEHPKIFWWLFFRFFISVQMKSKSTKTSQAALIWLSCIFFKNVIVAARIFKQFCG